MTVGWGSAVGKVFDWVPGRREHLRNKRNKLKKEMDELLKKPYSVDNSRRYGKLADKLYNVETKLANS